MLNEEVDPIQIQGDPIEMVVAMLHKAILRSLRSVK